MTATAPAARTPAPGPPGPARFPRLLLPLLAAVTLLVTVCFRVAAPSDIYDKDQSKTIAYTADMVRNGQWALPRDTLMQPATKPPLYNWLSAPIPAMFDVWSPWAFKLPSLLAALGILWLTIHQARRMLVRAADVGQIASRDVATAGAWLAGIIWLASYPTTELMYLARPDMLLTAFLIGTWVFGSDAMDRDPPHNRMAALGFWLCVTGATLTKGPIAVLGIVYVLMVARLQHGRWSAASRIGWRWGVLLVLGIAGAWCAFAVWQNAHHFGVKMLGNEFLLRVVGGPPERGLAKAPPWSVVNWFRREFQPWSVLAAVGVLMIPFRQWLKHPLTPAVLWGVMVAIFIGLSQGKRQDYLAPAYPAAAALAAYAVVRFASRSVARQRVVPAAVAIVAIAIAAGIGLHRWTLSPEAVGRHSENLHAFIDEIKPIVRDEPMVVLVRGYHPILPLMGRHGGQRPTIPEVREARWVITPVPPHKRWPAAVMSRDIGYAYHGRWPYQVALWDMTKAPPPTFENLMEFYALEGVSNFFDFGLPDLPPEPEEPF